MTDKDRTMIQITQIATDIQTILEQYNTGWMPPKLKRQWVRTRKEAQKLEAIADGMIK